MSTEADTCRKYVLPRLIQAGWDNEPHSFTEQRTFTDGRIVVTGNKVRRRSQKRADYLLRYTRDFPIAVVEAKAEPVSIDVPSFSTWPTATSSSTTPRIRSSLPLGMPAGRLRTVRPAKVVKCTSPSIRPSLWTSGALAFTKSTPQTS